MGVLVLNQEEVERLLDMEGCIEAMAEALASLARGEVHVPLRFVVKPEGEPSLIGLMPAHRGGDTPLYSLKTVCVFPDNPKRGLDAHQGTVTLFDGETGEVRALMNASAITAIRTAAVSAVATRLLAREDASELGILGAGVQARSHLEALRLVRDFDRVRIYSPTAEHAQSLADEAGAEAVGSAEEAVRDADVVVTATSSTDPVLQRDWLKEGAHVNVVGGRPPQMRELDVATVADSSFYVDRRESAENEACDYRDALEAGAIGPDHIKGEIGEVLIGARPGRTAPDELTVFRSLGLAVEDLAAAEYVVRKARETGAGTEVDVLIPFDAIRSAQETLAGTAVRTPLVRLHADAPAEIYLKLENLQPIGSFKIRGAYNAARRANPADVQKGLVTASAGNMAQGVAWAARELGVPCTVIAPDHAPQTKVDAIERLGGRVIKEPFDALVERDRRVAVRRRRRPLPAPGRERGRDGRQRHDRHRDPRGPPRRGRRAHPVGRRRAHRRDRERDQGEAARGEDLRRRAGDRRAAERDPRGGDADGDRVRALVHRRSRRAGAAAQDVGARRSRCSTAPTRRRWTRRRRRSGCSPSGCA